jgi:hypothetical protein
LRIVDQIQTPFGVRSIALTGLFILAVFHAVYVMRSILLPIQSEVSRYFFTITAINACLGIGHRDCDSSVCATRFITLMERDDALGSARRPFG